MRLTTVKFGLFTPFFIAILSVAYATETMQVLVYNAYNRNKLKICIFKVFKRGVNYVC